MGEIADMMLDGTMCAGCGEWLNDGEDGNGYPEYCSGCRSDYPPSSGITHDMVDDIERRKKKRLKNKARLKRKKQREKLAEFAPELLEALKNMCILMDDFHGGAPEQARAIIAKAEGNP